MNSRIRGFRRVFESITLHFLHSRFGLSQGAESAHLVEGIFLEGYPARRYQSAWMGIIVHSLQSAFIVIVVLILVLK